MYRKMLNIFLLLCAVFSVFILSSCEKKEYTSYSEIDSVIYSSILRQDDDEYIVFFYGNTCVACEELEELICEYATKATSKRKMMPLYLINTSNTRVNKGVIASEGDDSYNSFVGTTNYQDIKIATTPALIVVQDGKVTKLISTKVTTRPKTDIKNFIQELL